jgi:hypothetical protein
MTHFTLKAPYSPNRTIFLDGDFTYHKFLPDYRMMWDSEYGVYRSAVLLKQGAYNYRYISVEDGQVSMLDGNYYETSNEYLIRVYYRAPGARYDRLIGTKILHSK